MTKTMKTTAVAATETTTTEARKRFSFGPVWSAAVIAGKVTDHEKLIAHAVKIKVGTKSDMKRLKFDTLLAKVATALQAAPAAEEVATTETTAVATAE